LPERVQKPTLIPCSMLGEYQAGALGLVVQDAILHNMWLVFHDLVAHPASSLDGGSNRHAPLTSWGLAS
jgi:hypothetical protein